MPRIYEPGLAGPDTRIPVRDAPDGPGGGFRPGPTFNAPSTGESTPAPASLDYSSYLGMFGLPADLAKKINQIFATTTDANQAIAMAQAYVRGTDWYKQTYPGISEAISKGLVNNEADYRQLLNQQSQVYKQYTGRDITADEFANNLRMGLSTSTLANQFQGNTLAKTYGQDWGYLLGNFGDAGASTSQSEMTALGQEQAGIDTPLGQAVKRRLDMAQQRFQSIFRGSLATPAMSLSTGGLSAPGLTGNASKSDVSA